MNKIAIIDHVGNKSGMDFYDISLANELCNNVDVSIFSNFETTNSLNTKVYNKKVFNKKKANETKLDKIIYFFLGHFKAFINTKKRGIKTVLLHSFSYEIKDVLIYIIAKLFRFRIYLIAHDVSGFANSDNQKIKLLILKNITTKVLVHNEFSRKELLKENLNENKIITIRHGGYIDQVNSNISSQEAFSVLNLSKDYKYILFFGQIKEVKGLDVLIKAFHLLNNNKTKLIIAGKVWKDDFGKYQDLINQYNLLDKVILHTRFITDSEKDMFFKISDLVVIPYKKIYQSGVLLTALSYPSIVLCSNLEPNKEVIIDNENGFLFDSNNSQSLSEKIDYILKLSTQEKKITKDNALKTIKYKFNWQYPASQIIKNL
ncbi:glycosyltransferase family 4 protein [Algibacter pectinivorans]|uniref:Glycosyltransferase involved in cell wall bisynthesis n=1 Tax=Algibacter pectinivorans TaxID=870482 RepID=A0A1I1NKH6_9FLAO|nr:glycosyltransferase family 4 protein [Algibacter pectinivorans]SFC95988.1 Glycosyltransferase involved in cell wall bisynthesis [Algibacter pectinivorans]